MKYLSQFDLLQIRTRLQAATGRTYDLMNPDALLSALAAPRQVVFGQEMRHGVVEKAAILFSRLVQNHPFYDGNKRIALDALRLFLARNNHHLAVDDAEILRVAHQLVASNLTDAELESWVERNLT